VGSRPAIRSLLEPADPLVDVAVRLPKARCCAFHHVGVVVGDPCLSNERSKPSRRAHDPGLRDGDVVDTQEILDLVWRIGRGHLKLQTFDRLEHGPSSCYRAGPLLA
jgi:hypothetical protein